MDNYFHEQFSTREMLDGLAAATPLGRLAANEEMASAAMFLCPSASSYVIGQTLEVNGGLYMV